MQKEYERAKSQTGDKEYRARHILVETEEQAKNLIDELKKGGKFEDLATKNSKDPGSAQRGGDLDWNVPGTYDRQFADALVKLVDFGLVKVMSPDEEMTITVIQGQGTALYTPLEQYGSDETHTDTRTDIYSFGATLYHLLTNEPPPDARKRFLQPASLVAPRDLNPSISARTEKAVLWAMSLHPDDRPVSIEAFNNFLFAEGDSNEAAPRLDSVSELRPSELFGDRIDRTLGWAAAADVWAVTVMFFTVGGEFCGRYATVTPSSARTSVCSLP